MGVHSKPLALGKVLEAKVLNLLPPGEGRHLGCGPESVGQRHLDGRRDYSQQLWALMILELWFRQRVNR